MERNEQVENIKAEICKAYSERFPDREHGPFGVADELVIEAAIHNKDTFDYDSLNDCLELPVVDLPDVPTGIVITYSFNQFHDFEKPIPLELQALCGGHLTPLSKVRFYPTDPSDFKVAVDLLYKRAYSVSEGCKRQE